MTMLLRYLDTSELAIASILNVVDTAMKAFAAASVLYVTRELTVVPSEKLGLVYYSFLIFVRRNLIYAEPMLIGLTHFNDFARSFAHSGDLAAD